MKRVLTICSLVVLLGTASTIAIADIAKPKPAPQQKEGKVVLHTGLEIAVDPRGSEARLQIRESTFKELQAGLTTPGGNQNIATAITANPNRTVIAGVLLFLSLSVAGVWFARSKRSALAFGRVQKTIVIAFVCVSVLGAAAIVTQGNAGPPPYYRWRSLADNLNKGEPTIGSVNVEIVPDSADGGSGMKLIIPLRKQGPAE